MNCQISNLFFRLSWSLTAISFNFINTGMNCLVLINMKNPIESYIEILNRFLHYQVEDILNHPRSNTKYLKTLTVRNMDDFSLDTWRFRSRRFLFFFLNVESIVDGTLWSIFESQELFRTPQRAVEEFGLSGDSVLFFLSFPNLLLEPRVNIQISHFGSIRVKWQFLLLQ